MILWAATSGHCLVNDQCSGGCRCHFTRMDVLVIGSLKLMLGAKIPTIDSSVTGTTALVRQPYSERVFDREIAVVSSRSVGPRVMKLLIWLRQYVEVSLTGAGLLQSIHLWFSLSYPMMSISIFRLLSIMSIVNDWFQSRSATHINNEWVID
jgi:hypothetical protein